MVGKICHDLTGLMEGAKKRPQIVQRKWKKKDEKIISSTRLPRAETGNWKWHRWDWRVTQPEEADQQSWSAEPLTENTLRLSFTRTPRHFSLLYRQRSNSWLWKKIPKSRWMKESNETKEERASGLSDPQVSTTFKKELIERQWQCLYQTLGSYYNKRTICLYTIQIWCHYLTLPSLQWAYQLLSYILQFMILKHSRNRGHVFYFAFL